MANLIMGIIESIIAFFKDRRTDLDKPLTLLGKNYYNVRDKVYSSRYEPGEVDGGLEYSRYDEEDSNVKSCIWLTVKIINTIGFHEEDELIHRAGKRYIDEDENFADEIIRAATAGLTRVRGKEGTYYHYDDETYLRVEKYYDSIDERWIVEVEYIRHKPAKKKKEPSRRTVSEDRERIMRDIENHLRG